MKYIAIFISAVMLLTACNTQKRLAQKKHAYMVKTYTDIKDSITEAEVVMLNDTIKVLFPEKLLFEVGKIKILPTTYPLLNRFANALNLHKKTSILINGYTDNSGLEEVNDQLSINRAKNTEEVLAQYGVAETRMFTWGRGSRNPVASNNTAAGRRKNRRVEFIILYSYTPESSQRKD